MASFSELFPGIGTDYRRRRHELLHGFFPGVVEINDDPRNIGRVKVRIGGIHAFENGPDKIPPEKLPWAWRVGPAYMHTVPQVGDTVVVGFMMGDHQQPFYIGTTSANLKRKQIKGRLAYLPDPEPINKEDRMGNVGSYGDPGANNAMAYEQPEGNEAPEEFFERRRTTAPTLQVIIKSMRGHTIYTEDNAGDEALKIIDRMGQLLAFHCPVSEDANRGNMARRGLKEAENGSQLGLDNTNGEVSVTLMDAVNQFLRLDAGAGKLRLQGVKIDGTGNPHADGKINYIEISRSPCKIQIQCELKGRIIVDDGVLINDDAGAQVDVHGGSVKISGTRIDLN